MAVSVTRRSTETAVKAYYDYINKSLYRPKPDARVFTGVFKSSVPKGVEMTDLSFIDLVNKVYLAIESLIANDFDSFMYVKLRYEDQIKHCEIVSQLGLTRTRCDALRAKALDYIGNFL